MKVAIAAHLDDAAIRLCRENLESDDVQWVGSGSSASGWRDSLARCEVVFGNVPAAWIPELAALRWLQLESVGFEYYRDVSEQISTRGIAVTNLRGQFAHPAAETALAGILGLFRGIDQLVRANVERHWVSLEVRPSTDLLHGKDVIILGSGSIGSQLRRLLEAFDCRVRSFARTSPSAELHTLVELDAALPEAHIVVCCLPSTPDTRLLFDRKRIARLAATAVFVNIGRGSVVDEVALAAALVDGSLGGAVLDVTNQEPIGLASPLWALPRTVLTQHTGGGYSDELVDKARRFLENLDRWRAGEPLDNLVNWQAGY